MKQKDYESLKNGIYISIIGWLFFSCILIGFLIGYFIDRYFKTEPLFTIVFVIIGMIGGFMELYRMTKRIMNKETIQKREK